MIDSQETASSRAPLPEPRRGLLVIGMHRSGTSAAARMFGLLGARLPSELMPANEFNTSGYWEPERLVALHDEMLESVGSTWYDISAFPDSWYESETAASFASRALEILEQEYETAPLFVLKDPRISRFVPFWLSVLETLGAEPSFIIMVRQPLEVAASLKQRDALLPAHSILLWLRHMLDAERATRRQRRAFLFYDRLLGDWHLEADQLAEHLDLQWPSMSPSSSEQIEAFLSEGLRHHDFGLKDLKARHDVVDWVKEAYELLCHEGDTPVLHSAFDRIGDRLAKADLAFGPIVAGARLETEDLSRRSGQLEEEILALQSDLAERVAEVGEQTVELDRRQSVIDLLEGELAVLRSRRRV